ncbi:MAG: 50S ribosomal protein L10 [Chloroflexota bacterium]|nr:50S ribosomal protein L10 [Chloroflexota bacterium]
MPTDGKRAEVAELTKLLRGSSAVAVADYRGLRVTDIQAVRRSLRANGVTFRVVKNRLMSIAADEAGVPEMKPILDGPTAVAVGAGDEAVLARSVLEALRPYSRVVKVRGAVLGTRLIDADGLQRLSSLPGREVILGQVAGAMQAPLAALASVLAGNLRNLVGVLSAIAEQKGSAGGTAAGG